MGCKISKNKYNNVNMQTFLKELDDEFESLTNNVFVYCCEQLLSGKESSNYNILNGNISNITTLYEFIFVTCNITKNNMRELLEESYYTPESFDRKNIIGIFNNSIDKTIANNFNSYKNDIKKYHVNKSSHKTKKLYILEKNKMKWCHKEDVVIFSCDNSKYLEYVEHNYLHYNKFQINLGNLYRSINLTTCHLNMMKNLFDKKINLLNLHLDELENFVSSDNYIQFEKTSVALENLLKKSDFNMEDGIEYKKLQLNRNQLFSQISDNISKIKSLHSIYSKREFENVKQTIKIILDIKQNIKQSYNIISAYIC